MSASAPKSLNDSLRTRIATALGLNPGPVPAGAMIRRFTDREDIAR